MKLVGNIVGIDAGEDGSLLIMIKTSPVNLPGIQQLKELKENLDIELKRISQKRTLRQNAYLWSLINEICKAEDGSIEGAEDLYIQLLEKCGAKTAIVNMPESAYDNRFKALVRHSRLLKQQVVRNTVWNMVQIYYGSSTFDKDEMRQLIDVTLDYASNIEGINLGYWEDILRA